MKPENHNTLKCTNAEPDTYGHECGKPAQWTAASQAIRTLLEAEKPHDQTEGRRLIEQGRFEYEAVILNGSKGWIATRRIDGVHAGKQFGKTQKAAREAFDILIK